MKQTNKRHFGRQGERLFNMQTPLDEINDIGIDLLAMGLCETFFLFSNVNSSSK
jgi:hypothetical protein